MGYRKFTEYILYSVFFVSMAVTTICSKEIMIIGSFLSFSLIDICLYIKKPIAKFSSVRYFLVTLFCFRILSEKDVEKQKRV